MDTPMFYQGNQEPIAPNMTLFAHMIIMDSDTETAMTLAVVSPGEFNGLLDRCPTLARAVLSSLASRMRAVAAA